MEDKRSVIRTSVTDKFSREAYKIWESLEGIYADLELAQQTIMQLVGIIRMRDNAIIGLNKINQDLMIERDKYKTLLGSQEFYQDKYQEAFNFILSKSLESEYLVYRLAKKNE